jgi:hypothetical protein
MMRTLRVVAFGFAEGVRLYLAAVKSVPGDSGELVGQARPVAAELAHGVQGGRA